MVESERVLIVGLEVDADPLLQELADQGKVVYRVAGVAHHEHATLGVFTDPEAARAYATEFLALVREEARLGMGAMAESDDHGVSLAAVPLDAPREALPGGWFATVALDGTVRKVIPRARWWTWDKPGQVREIESCPKPGWEYTSNMDDLHLAQYEGRQDDIDDILERYSTQTYEEREAAREARAAERREKGRFFQAFAVTREGAIRIAQEAAAKARATCD